MWSFSSLLCDTRNFIKNNFASILIVVGSLSIISQIISFFLSPDLVSIQVIQLIIQKTTDTYGSLTPEGLSQTLTALNQQEQQQFVTAALGYVFKTGLVFLVNNLILMSGLVGLIYVIAYQQLTVKNISLRVIQLIPKILLFILLTIPCFIILSILSAILLPLAVPLAFLAMLFYIIIYVIFLSVIIESTPKTNFMRELKVTLRFFKREIRFIVPIIIIWLLLTFVLNVFVGTISTDNFVILLVINVIKSSLIFTVICYLYRLFSLSKKALPYDSSN